MRVQLFGHWLLAPMDNLNPVSPQFVFLIGAARSGTKFLRDVLAASDFVARVPFDVNYVWRYGNESLPDDRIDDHNATPEIRQYIRATLTRMARRSKGFPAPIVIEKSVSNVFRVPFMFRLFPDAKFIHLVRDGRDVSLSAARQWENPSDARYLIGKIRYFPLRNVKYALWFLKNALSRRSEGSRRFPVWGPRYSGIDRDVAELTAIEIAAKQWSESVLAASEGLALIPDQQKSTIRYEDLVSNVGFLSKLTEFLELPDPDTVIANYNDVLEGGKSGAWRALPETEQSAMLRLIEPQLRQLGYYD